MLRAPLVQPGGSPRVTEAVDAVDTEVDTWPEGSVKMNVKSVGEGETVGMAVALRYCVPSTGLYVLVARPVETIKPGGAEMDVLNA